MLIPCCQALSCLDKKNIDQLVSAIQKPGGMKGGTWNPIINVPLHQCCCGEKFHPSLVNLEGLEEFWLQQEIEEAHNNKWLIILDPPAIAKTALQAPI